MNDLEIQKLHEREQKIAGLRELAAFLEDHPEVPVPPGVEFLKVWFTGFGSSDRDDFLSMVAALPNWKGSFDDSAFIATTEFSGGVCIKAQIPRSLVCRSVEVPAINKEWVFDPEGVKKEEENANIRSAA